MENSAFLISNEEYEQITAEIYHSGGARYDTLLTVSRRIIIGLIRYYCQPTSLADEWEDVLQEALVDIYTGCEQSYFYGNQDREKSPEGLRKWILTVVRNTFLSCLKNSKGRSRRERETAAHLLEKMGIEATVTDEGLVKVAPRVEPEQLDLSGKPIWEQEKNQMNRERLLNVFHSMLQMSSGVQIVLMWLCVYLIMYENGGEQHQAIDWIAKQDRRKTLADWLFYVVHIFESYDWIDISPKEYQVLSECLEKEWKPGIKYARMHFGDFTKEDVKSYISKSLNKRNQTIRKRVDS